MRGFLVRAALAFGITLAAISLAGSANAQDLKSSNSPATAAQQASQPMPDPAQTPSRFPQEPNVPSTDAGQKPGKNEAQIPAAGTAMQTQDPQTFSGKVVKESGAIVLKDPVTKISYRVDDVAKVRKFLSRDVKIKGSLELNSNMIHVASVEPISPPAH